ncbi:MAG: hypothetical protein JXN59_15710 [Anaerolineae bacterium]|nr:hypothetical protein [Anaerolineae bacterium]
MVKQASKKRKPSRLLPILGLLLGIAFALVALVLLPTAKAFLVKQGVAFGGATSLVIDLLIGGVIWVVLFGAAMFIVSLAIGTHEDDKVAMEYYKRSADRRKREKYEKEKKRQQRMAMRDYNQTDSKDR